MACHAMPALPRPLQEGKIVFQGNPAEAVKVFAKLGYPCPPLTNPADHVMDMISPQIHADGRVHSTSFRLQEPPVIE